MKEKENKYSVVIVGRPNVGKSSLFNRLIGTRKAVILAEPGTTRDLIEEEVEINGRTVNLIDTAGYLENGKDEIAEKAYAKLREAIARGNKIIYVVDGEVPPTEEDKRVADVLRKTGKETILVVNKIDSTKKKNYAGEYARLGFKPVVETSTIHNLGIASLKEEIAKDAPKGKKKVEKETTKVAIIGRPNVGKSSILNALCGKDKAIVTDIAGTTRDVVTEKVTYGTAELALSDTAGARRPGKIGRAFKKGAPLERFAYLRTEREVESSDIVLLVLDATEQRATTQDLHIAGLAKEAGKGVILVINKWDLTSEITQEKFLARLRNRFGFMRWVPAIFVSAETGLNIEKIGEIVEKVAENQRRRIPTPKLNRIIEDFSLRNIPKARGKYRPKIFYAVQTQVVPPTFEIRAKHHDAIHFSWQRALANELRKEFDFTGTPIKIIFKKK
ncbi:MAG: ribosome biogenesis GTPase Der [Patescibacteria group bacterium]|nr:ribosome biogenesis GTPase Der [Patescibacteria group bacterium]